MVYVCLLSYEKISIFSTMFTLHKNVRQPSNALTNLHQLSQSQKYIMFATINRILTTLLRIISRTIWTHSLIQPVTTRENEQCGYTSSRDRFSFDCNTKTIRLVSQIYKGVILKLPRAKVNFNMYCSYGGAVSSTNKYRTRHCCILLCVGK